MNGTKKLTDILITVKHSIVKDENKVKTVVLKADNMVSFFFFFFFFFFFYFLENKKKKQKKKKLKTHSIFIILSWGKYFTTTFNQPQRSTFIALVIFQLCFLQMNQHWHYSNNYFHFFQSCFTNISHTNKQMKATEKY